MLIATSPGHLFGISQTTSHIPPALDLRIRSIELEPDIEGGQGNMQLRAEIKVPMEGNAAARLWKLGGGGRGTAGGNIIDPIGKSVLTSEKKYHLH